jgi:hypothetical protein
VWMSKAEQQLSMAVTGGGGGEPADTLAHHGRPVLHYH